MDLSRRSMLLGVGAMLATPAIVRADSLMKVRGIIMPMQYKWSDVVVSQIDHNSIDFSAYQYSVDLLHDSIMMDRVDMTGKALADVIDVANRVPNDIKLRAYETVDSLINEFHMKTHQVSSVYHSSEFSRIKEVYSEYPAPGAARVGMRWADKYKNDGLTDKVVDITL